ncbi:MULTISPECIES: pyridoxal-phosphate dependent enzyme [unclassified Crossiella]|uniref:pyridoxal-phosphate dependent enzyme n=1 Tax=unclassified Crossiella TaxID=2620835 RepID=UPI001FFF486D|nr:MULTISPECIES: pyridoxal-phosphate dependent enzyme [unclassified Crossiella]MCK2242253.1 pyridoxal-phosphate dependent enzyme [Crossiella sp. S99.2]MCK2254716.1 pyridoxal-phosphate dependent enzyme [Crossiella sp. S99.1]
MTRLPTPADVASAAERIAPYVRRTPMLRVTVDGRPLWLKLEQLQLTGSFKLRGATNALLSGPRPERVATVSGGNHGYAVGTAARLLDLPTRVHVPVFAAESKVRRIKETGAEVVRHETYPEANRAARLEGGEPGGLYVSAYDDPAVIAGQGTVGLEIVADAPEVDALFVAVGGGGGLAAGLALGAGRRIIAVEPEGCHCLHAALAAGQPVHTEVDSVAMSALGAAQAGDLTYAILRASGVESHLVSDAELLAARDRLWDEFRLAVEPAAAVPFALWLKDEVAAEHPCVVLCGANTDWTPES